MEAGGNSGVFVWSNATRSERSGCPTASRCRCSSSNGRSSTHATASSRPIAYVHGELFGVGGVKTMPDNPRGERSMSIENRAQGRGEWNTYDVVAVDGVDQALGQRQVRQRHQPLDAEEGLPVPRGRRRGDPLPQHAHPGTAAGRDDAGADRARPALRRTRHVRLPRRPPPGRVLGPVERRAARPLPRYTAGRRLTLYPAQEEAILELLDGKNVILNTPTGSGKSLVASALLFAALARGQRAVYTCPIKALVNEKWMGLCREFGPDQVGLSTGDATVNRDAPILCCTAEVLANIALREGADAAISDVVMDEFHYYADRDRGVAWQVPLLTHAAGAVPADVGDARRHAVLRGGAHAPQRARDGHGEVRRSARAARVRLLRDPAGAHDREARGRGQDAGLRRPLHAGRRGRERAGLHEPQDLHPGAEGRDRGAHRRLRVQQPVRRRHPQVAPARHRPAPRGAAAQVPRARRAARAGGPAAR